MEKSKGSQYFLTNKNVHMKQLKFVLLTVTVILIFSSCEKEIKTNPILQSSDSEISTRSAHKVWERLTWTELQSDLQFLEIVDKLKIEVMYQGSQLDQIFIDSSTISKCSDITNDYSSFTFPVHSEPSSSKVIKNVVLEKKGMSYKSNIIEYTIGFDDLYALMTNTFTDPINIPVNIYPVDPNTIQLRGCVWITIEFTIPCPWQGHTNPDFCSCGTQPIVSYHTYLACDDSTGGDDEGINIYPTGDTTPGTGGGGGDPVGDDNGDNTGTELLIPTTEWYLIKLHQFNDDYDLDLTIEELEEIIPIDCMGDGNPLVGEFEKCVGKKLLKNLYETDITNVRLIEGYIFGIDENGILKIYFSDVPDPADLSSQELFDQVILVLNCVQLYYCETLNYEPIDWSDYFDNVNGGSYLINWDANVTFESCPVGMLLDFTWGGYLMNTDYSHLGQTSDNPSINHWKWTGVNSDAAILQISTKSINNCKDILYYFFNPICN